MIKFGFSGMAETGGSWPTPANIYGVLNWAKYWDVCVRRVFTTSLSSLCVGDPPSPFAVSILLCLHNKLPSEANSMVGRDARYIIVELPSQSFLLRIPFL